MISVSRKLIAATTVATAQGRVSVISVRRKLGTAARAAIWATLVLMAVSLVPGDEAYYQAERLLADIEPLASASRHIRSAPSTASSILMEPFQDRTLEVEGLHINLDYAVNPTVLVEDIRFTSQVLGENRGYRVYLPPGYSESASGFPVLVLLHGMSQDQRWWTEVARVDRIATAMIESGKIRPMIIAMPNGNRVQADISTTSIYDDHCRTGLDILARFLKAVGDAVKSLRIYKVSCDGNFEDYIAKELVQDIDTRYNTSGERYIGGFSTGGRGALQLALGNDGVFGGAFGLSGNYDFLRRWLRSGGVPSADARLFLASGANDQRGVYGELGTFLFHKDLAARGIGHLYCSFDRTHGDTAWVSALPLALRYLFASEGNIAPEGKSALESSSSKASGSTVDHAC